MTILNIQIYYKQVDCSELNLKLSDIIYRCLFKFHYLDKTHWDKNCLSGGRLHVQEWVNQSIKLVISAEEPLPAHENHSEVVPKTNIYSKWKVNEMHKLQIILTEGHFSLLQCRLGEIHFPFGTANCTVITLSSTGKRLFRSLYIRKEIFVYC